MITRQKKRSNRSQLIIPVLSLLVFGYFGSQAYQGNYGIDSHAMLKKRSVLLKQKLAGLQFRRTKLESRILLLRDGTIEKDMLDEQIRKNLGYVHENDIVIMR